MSYMEQKISNQIDAGLSERDELYEKLRISNEKIAVMREALFLAELTFSSYGDIHAAKPDPIKAHKNYELAGKMNAALVKCKDIK